METRRAAAPLTLTADEVNALIALAPGLSGKVWVKVEGDKVRARFCLPLEDLVSLARSNARNWDSR